MLDELKEVLRHKNFATKEEAQKFVNEYMQKYDQSPIDDLGGLSPDKMYRLLYTPVIDSKSPIVLNKDLTEEELANSLFYQDAKKVLKLIMDCQPKMTATEKFCREFVKAVTDLTGYTTETRNLFKIINEGEEILHGLKKEFCFIGIFD